MLGERLDNRMRHLSKWARKQGISCFRLYEKDIPEFPMIVDWYGAPGGGGDAVAWFFHRTKDDTLQKEREYRIDAEAERFQQRAGHVMKLAIVDAAVAPRLAAEEDVSCHVEVV